jgi:hypothetical protein
MINIGLMLLITDCRRKALRQPKLTVNIAWQECPKV